MAKTEIDDFFARKNGCLVGWQAFILTDRNCCFSIRPRIFIRQRF